jgi:hypothetical protein
MKTTWNSITSERGKKVDKGDVHLLNVNGNLTINQQMIANPFNNCFKQLQIQLLVTTEMIK